MLPGAAHIIHCVRDPRDIGLSIFTFRFHGHHGYAHDLADLGWTIAQQDRLIGALADSAAEPGADCKLADLVTDFAGTLARVAGAPWVAARPCLRTLADTDSRVRTVSRAQVRQPVNARGLGRILLCGTARADDAELEQAGALKDRGGPPATEQPTITEGNKRVPAT